MNHRVETHDATTGDPFGPASDDLLMGVVMWTVKSRQSVAEKLDALERLLARREDSLYDYTVREHPAMVPTRVDR